MKKRLLWLFLIIIAAVCLAAGVCACGGGTDSPVKTTNPFSYGFIREEDVEDNLFPEDKLTAEADFSVGARTYLTVDCLLSSKRDGGLYTFKITVTPVQRIRARVSDARTNMVSSATEQNGCVMTADFNVPESDKSERVIVLFTPIQSGECTIEIEILYAGESTGYSASVTAQIVQAEEGSGLAYKLNDDKKSYSVTGLGFEKGDFIYVPENYEGLPVTGIADGAFKGCTFSEVIIPESVVNIGKEAFYGCGNLIANPLGKRVERIDDFAFCNCVKISEMIIPDSVTELGASIFFGCSALKKVTLPNGVLRIGDYTFSGCIQLNEVTVPDSVTEMGTGVFAGCTSLRSIALPFVGAYKDATEDGGEQLFGYIFGTDSFHGGAQTQQNYSVAASETYYVPNSLESVEVTGGRILYGAFSNCTRLKSITLGEEVSALGNYAFYGCTALAEVNIPAGITTVGSYVFSNCTSLAGIALPDSVTAIYTGAFAGCTSLAEITVPDATTVLYDSAFLNCTNLSEVRLGARVGNVASRAFEGCTSLTSISLPDGVKNIGDCAFFGCADLAEVNLPTSLTSIGSNAFERCAGLKSIAIPQGVTQIKNYTFSGCKALVRADVANGVTKIGNYAFAGCASLQSIAVPERVTEIGTSAFTGCGALAEIELPFVGASSGATTVSATTLFGYIFGTASYTGGVKTRQYYSTKDSVYYYLPDTLKKVSIKNCESILRYSFNNCDGIEELVIADSVKSIGAASLSGCASLKSITLPFVGASNEQEATGSSTLFGTIFGSSYYMGGATTYQNSATVSNMRFYVPASLTNVEVTGGSIKDGAFSGCEYISSVTLCGGITGIESKAFAGCSSLRYITFKDTKAVWEQITKAADWGSLTVKCTDGDA